MFEQKLDNLNIDEQVTHDLANGIQKIRTKICNAFSVTFAIIAVPSLMASLYRITAVGWQPVMNAHIVIVAILWLMVLLRNRLSYNVQASFIVVMFLVIGLWGIYQFGLLAGGIGFLVVSSPIATLLFGVRIGLATLFVALSGSIIIAVLVVSGNLQYEFDLSAYATALPSWLNSVIGWGLASAALTAALYVYNKKLVQALAISIHHQNALQLNEERLKMVLEGSEQGFWDWNIDTGEVKRNERWAQMLGYKTIKEFEDNTDTWTNSIYADDRDAAWASINQHLEGHTASHKLEYRMLTKDGGYKWILDHAKIVQRDSDGRPMRMSGTHCDITVRKEMEKEKEELVTSLQNTMSELKILRGIIPICSYCHNIRDEEGAWKGIEIYISMHSDAKFSHGICPKCLPKVRSEAGLDDGTS